MAPRWEAWLGLSIGEGNAIATTWLKPSSYARQMVEGGWYFCPNEESNDLASCAYCKLSLDGWEPKDDPL